jgi:general secretion pathway protein D
VRHTLARLVPVLLVALVVSGCAAAMSFKKGQSAAGHGDWDAAVAHFRTAVQEDPDKPEYKIALERAMLDAALMHAAAGKEFENKGQLDAAVREFRRASEYDPANRQLAAHVADIDRRIRELIEASRPRPKIDEMRDRARQMSPEPTLNPASREPLDLHFSGSVRDLLKFIGDATGINISFTGDYHDPPQYTVQLTGVTLEQALQQVLSANGLFYKVVNDRTILVIPENAQNRAKYEEMVIRTFYLSHADSQEVVQLLNTIMRVPGVPLVPAFVANKTQNSITVRGAAPLVAIMERLIEANDRPPAEIVLDVQIMEVSRTRAKQFGLDLSQYSITGVFSPEVAPGSGTTTGTGGATTGSTGATGTTAPPFNLNTITRGISAADFYMAVPTAIVRFLESDSQTKLVAKPQLRGQEGQKITLNLGDQIPIAQTTFGSFGGAGSIASTPVSSYTYKDVGINVEVTPRVTFDGDVVLELVVENSALGQDVNIAGQNYPSFASRKVETKIRLRDGESTLLAGLLREDSRRTYKGFPGLMHLPVFRQLFSSNDLSTGQTDIVILMTPHIVRGHELTQQDVDPVYIGSQQNLGLTGPPPLIAAPPQDQPAPEGPASPQGGITGQPTPGQPSGTLAAPGIMPTPTPAAPATPPAAPTEPQAAEAPPALQPEPAPVTAPESPPEAPGAVRLLVTSPGSEFRLGGGPYTVPISVATSPRLNALTVTVTFNPAVLRVRSVQPGSFMRQGGVDAQFTQQVDAVSGRVDITVTRSGDVVGATGSGLVAAVLFDPVAAGATIISAAGAATGPGGAALTVQTTPAAVTVK